MIANSIRDSGKTILILGIDYVSAVLGTSIREYGNSVLFWCPNSDLVEHYRSRGMVLDTVENIDNYNFESVDFIILSQGLFFDDFGSSSNLLKKVKQTASKVFLAVEIVKILFPENKFVAIFGRSCKNIIYSALSCIFSNSQTNITELPAFLTNDQNSDSELDVGLNLQENNIFVLDLTENEINYLRDLSFDVIVILNLEKEEHIPVIRNLLTKQSNETTFIVNADNTMFKNFSDTFGLADSNSVKTILISVEKMIENGYSYVNSTIYNYCYSNLSYDIANSGFIASNLNRLSVLSSFVVANVFSLEPAAIIANLENFKGLAHNMEQIKQSKNITFVDNSGANTLDLIESPFGMYSNIFVIFIASSKTGGDLVRLKNYRNNIRLSLLVDTFDTVGEHLEEFGSLRPEKVDSIKDALDKIASYVAEENIEDETIVILSPIFGDRMNSVHYSGSYGNEFKKLVEGL
ncbi:MAG: hypothetical protein LBP39_03885 [Rickettsiales bacterium]|jgi:UDP-N-acetylmuramoylalanine-D-glutamate ligase|nr:hypothetical protein [Rickettsiales bacterium]